MDEKPIKLKLVIRRSKIMQALRNIANNEKKASIIEYVLVDIETGREVANISDIKLDFSDKQFPRVTIELLSPAIDISIDGLDITASTLTGQAPINTYTSGVVNPPYAYTSSTFKV